MNLDLLGQTGETFSSAIYYAYYQQLAGHANPPSIASVYDTYRELFDLSRVQDVFGAYDTETDALRKKRLAGLRSFLALEYLNNQMKAETEALFTRESKAEIVISGNTRYPFRSARVVLANTEDRDRRHELDQAIHAIVGDFDDILTTMVMKLQDWAALFGFNGYNQAVQELQGYDISALCEAARRFLDVTRDAYMDFLKWYVEKILDLSLDNLYSHDLLYLFRSHHLDKAFPATALEETASNCLREMGLELRSEIILDMEARPNKRARAFCAPVKIPQQVYLTLFPQGGLVDFEMFFHELGHALHFSHTDPDLPFEFRYLGDDSITETFAMTMESVLRRPLWLNRYLDFWPDPDTARFLVLRKLYLIRRYCTKLLYEWDLYNGTANDDMAKWYAESMHSATAVRYDQRDYLYDVDPHYYCIAYLHAWALEAQLTTVLVNRFDEEWYRNPAAGTFLRTLWSQGQKPDVMEFSSRIGGQGPDIDFLATTILQDLA